MISSNKISIIIPFKNRVGVLKRTIKSVIDQTYNNIQLILIDDHSDLENMQQLHQYLVALNLDYIELYKRPESYKKGGNGARNFGLSKATGEFVKWFDSDDLMKPDFLEKQVNILLAGYDLTFCESEKWNSDFSTLLSRRWRKSIYSEDLIKDYLRGKILWSTPSGLWNRSIFEEGARPFNEDLKNSQEWLFHLQMIISGYKVAILDERLVKIRGGHAESISSNRNNEYNYNRLIARVYALNALSKQNSPGQLLLFYIIIYNLINTRSVPLSILRLISFSDLFFNLFRISTKKSEFHLIK